MKPNLAALTRMSCFLCLSLTVACQALAACTANAPPTIPVDTVTPAVPPATTVPMSTATAAAPLTTPTDNWLAFFQQQPFPYTTPLPPNDPTPLDGIYAKLEPITGTPVPCRRCPDYLAEDGIWRLNLRHGVYYIYHQPTGWRSLGSYSTEGNRLFLFNDPACHLTVGAYRWRLDKDGLTLTVIEDPCQVKRRAGTFSDLTWRSCQPPNTEAAVTEHWPRPPGCDPPP